MQKPKYLWAIILGSCAAFAAINSASAEESGMWESTKNVASDTWDGTKNVASDVWDGTKEVASDVWDGTKEVASDVKDGVTGDKNPAPETANTDNNNQ